MSAPSQGLDIEAIISQIRSGFGERTTIMAAVAELVTAGRIVPVEIEFAALKHYIKDDPSRLDLKRRMVSIARKHLIAIDEQIVQEVQTALLAQEHSTDFQALLDDFGKRVRYADMEPEFMEIFEQVRKYTMTTVERLYALWSYTGYLCLAELEGDVVECGVWRGGSVMTVALEMLRRGQTDRMIWLYDTFAGLPRPEAVDVDVLGNRAIDGWEAHTLPNGRTLWAYADEDDVRRNMARTGYPDKSMKFVAGMVEVTLPAAAPERIALLRLDTDWYASYKHVLNTLYDRVVPGGVIIFDDYGHFDGARKAVDEFRAERRITSPLLRVDYSCRLMMKLS